ncbi:amidohydrolase [Alkalibacterium putridalgicola]|jgi:amidohydrolase|uniref:Amidohydrolase n=1 Tax=Alkalibacterium putridalgicola TaxID=426703 RepID=A0A1H7WIV7_9LACT|nr:M20 family metallopeptidase [Alkalibacterium putridalgicola]GEK88559.1 amidohydrolase [Alkalibacterium putridalgicola]SEM21433.1 amidohydrolase [Alkalibacterium putridalgicola]
MSLIDELTKKLEAKQDRLIEVRRYLHAHPELSFQEEQTAAYLKDFYKNVPVDSIETDFGGNRGVVVNIKGGKPGPRLALRADFDALPILEETNLPFASQNKGVMHACGHDGHTAYMLILAETLAEMKDQLNGSVRIIHQPAEEMPPGGAKSMVEAGVLNGVDAVLGVHLMSAMETGNVYYRSGQTQTGRAKFTLKIQGKGGHGAIPHTANDAIVAASAFVMNVQTIVSRRVDPFDSAVVTIGSFDGKGQFNIIKDAVELEGDVRTLSTESRALVEDEVKKIAKGIESMYGVQAKLDYVNDYPVLVNDEEVTLKVKEAIEQANIPEINAVLETGPIAPSEDFAYYLQEKPGTFIYVGAKPEGKEGFPHHHPKFEIDERSLLISAKAMAAAVASYLG